MTKFRFRLLAFVFFVICLSFGQTTTNPKATSSTTTTVTITSGTIVAADVIEFSCIGY